MQRSWSQPVHRLWQRAGLWRTGAVGLVVFTSTLIVRLRKEIRLRRRERCLGTGLDHVKGRYQGCGIFNREANPKDHQGMQE